MAKISTYNIDNNIHGDDLLVGTDSNSTPPNLTKNFSVDKLVDYMNGYQTVEHVITDVTVIRALATTPFQLVPAPGLNKVVSALFMSVSTGGGDAYDFASSNIQAGLDGGGGVYSFVWVNSVGPLNAATRQSYGYYPTGCVPAFLYDSSQYNLPFQFSAVGGIDATQGTRPVKVMLQYQILDFGV